MKRNDRGQSDRTDRDRNDTVLTITRKRNGVRWTGPAQIVMTSVGKGNDRNVVEAASEEFQKDIMYSNMLL